MNNFLKPLPIGSLASHRFKIYCQNHLLYALQRGKRYWRDLREGQQINASASKVSWPKSDIKPMRQPFVI